MPAAYVPLVIDQGEDWTTDIVWTDSFDEPMPVDHPSRLDIKSLQGATLFQMETDPDIPEGTIPTIKLSTEMGLIQLHIPSEATAAMPPGEYHFDLFVTSSDGNLYAGPQQTRLLYGPVTVNKRVTQM